MDRTGRFDRAFIPLGVAPAVLLFFLKLCCLENLTNYDGTSKGSSGYNININTIITIILIYYYYNINNTNTSNNTKINTSGTLHTCVCVYRYHSGKIRPLCILCMVIIFY